MIMTDAEFEQKYHTSLLRIEEVIEAAITDDDIDLDYETVNDILTLECADESSIIITKQSATHQLWIAAKSGGFHFDLDEKSKGWICTTNQQGLWQMLEDIILQQGKVSLEF